MPRLEGLGMMYGGCLGLTYGLGWNGLADPDTHSSGSIANLDRPCTILGLASDVAARIAALDGPSGVWVAMADAVSATIAAEDEPSTSLAMADQAMTAATEDEPATEIGIADEPSAEIATEDEPSGMIDLADRIASATEEQDE